MSDDTLSLFPELAAAEPPLPRWEVRFTVRRRDGGEPLVPIGVPSGGRAVACWTAAEGVAVAWVEAPDEMAARATAAEACPGWAEIPGVTVTAERVRPRQGHPGGRSGGGGTRPGENPDDEAGKHD